VTLCASVASEDRFSEAGETRSLLGESRDARNVIPIQITSYTIKNAFHPPGVSWASRRPSLHHPLDESRNDSPSGVLHSSSSPPSQLHSLSLRPSMSPSLSILDVQPISNQYHPSFSPVNEFLPQTTLPPLNSEFHSSLSTVPQGDAMALTLHHLLSHPFHSPSLPSHSLSTFTLTSLSLSSLGGLNSCLQTLSGRLPGIQPCPIHSPITPLLHHTITPSP